MTMNHVLDRSNVTNTQCNKRERNDEIAIKPTWDDNYTKGFSSVISVEYNMLNTICGEKMHMKMKCILTLPQ